MARHIEFRLCSHLRLVPGRGVTTGISWWGCAARFFKSWPDFRPKNVIFHTRFQNRPLKSIPVFRPGFKAEIMLSLLRLERKEDNYSSPFRIRIFLFLSYSGIKTISTFIHSVVPLKTILDSRPQWAKCTPVFRPKRRKNPTRWGGTYIYGLYKGVPPGMCPHVDLFEPHSQIWSIQGCTAGQGTGFVLSVLNRVYNFVWVCQQDITCVIGLIW